MADPLSIAASIVGIAAAGVKVSMSLFALVETVSTACERVESIANDVSSTCGILNQLRDLVTPRTGPNGTHTVIFNSNALSDIFSAINHCHSIFGQIKEYLERATNQVRGIAQPSNSKIKLSRFEKAKWPFLQSPFHELRNNLRDSKTNILLMIAVANLAEQRRMFGRQIDEQEQTEMKDMIVSLQRAKTLELKSLDDTPGQEKENGLRRLFENINFRKGGRKKKLGNDSDENWDRRIEIKHAETSTGARKVIPNEKVGEQSNQTQPLAAATPILDSPTAEFSLPEASPKNCECSTRTDATQSTTPNAVVSQVSTAGGNEKKFEQLVTENAIASGVDPEREKAAPDSLETDVEALAPGDVFQTRQLINMLSEPRVATNMPSIETGTNSGRLEKGTPHRQSTLEEETPKASNVINIDEQKLSSPDTQAENIHDFLQAWIFSALPGLSSGFGTSVGIMELTLPETEIRALLQKQDVKCLHLSETLHKLNNYQRHLVIAHIGFGNSKLLHLDEWHKESIPTVFGLLDVVTLMWITSSKERREGSVDIEMLFGKNGGIVEEPDMEPLQDEVAKKGAIPIEPKESLTFKDVVGRKLMWPIPETPKHAPSPAPPPVSPGPPRPSSTDEPEGAPIPVDKRDLRRAAAMARSAPAARRRTVNSISGLAEKSNDKNRDDIVEKLLLKWTVDDEV